MRIAELEGYVAISRRDRCDGRFGCGITVYVLQGVAPNLVHIESVKDTERA